MLGTSEILKNTQRYPDSNSFQAVLIPHTQLQTHSPPLQHRHPGSMRVPFLHPAPAGDVGAAPRWQPTLLPAAR